MNVKEKQKREIANKEAKEKRRKALKLLEQLVELSIDDFLKKNRV
jgi:hypothetical protein